ncbi:MAG TPA: hypothetical protein VFX28_08230, partial [Methylomirabilota bacterium]|nr:hypothetical protein [Methylomirabilota bacterium]
MAQPFVEPVSIRRAAKPGETVTQDFVVNVVPNGSLVTTIVGGDSLIRLRHVQAFELVRQELTPDEIEQLPPHLRDKLTKAGAVEFLEVGRVGAGVPLAVRRGLHVSGEIEFGAPADHPPATVSATLVLEGWGGNRVEVPLLFVVGDVQVEFLVPQPIEAFRGQAVPLPVRVSMSAAAPPTDVTLESAEPWLDITPQTV